MPDRCAVRWRGDGSQCRGGRAGQQCRDGAAGRYEQYHVDVLIDETEVGQVQSGQKVEVTFDALPQAKVTGTVSRIDPAGTINQGVVYYNTRIDLDPTTSRC